MRKARSMAFSNYSPGPDLDDSPMPGIQTKPPLGHFGVEVDDAASAYAPSDSYLTRRIVSGMSQAAPTQQFTPDQAYFRGSAASGRWQSDGPAHAQLYSMTRDADTGAADIVRMEPLSRLGAADGWIDLGGKGGVDYAARRP